MPPSPSPSPSPSIQVLPHPSKRRALHATRSLAPGEIIHVFTSPLLLHPDLRHLGSLCAYCLRAGTPRACSRCQASFYCDASCQEAAWKAIHAKECKLLRGRTLGGAPAAELPTVVRVVVQALAKKEIEDALEALEGHEGHKRRNLKEWADVRMMGMAACAFAARGRGEQDVTRAMSLLCKIQTNAFHRFDEDLGGDVGILLEPTLAMANHSCIPNATVLFIKRKAVLRAEMAIQAGDEIEISYTDYTSPLAKRKEALASYNFECQCSRCRNNLNVYQVAAKSADVALDTWSVVGSDAARLRQHPAATDAGKISIAAQCCGDVDTSSFFSSSSPSSSSRAQSLVKSGLRACLEKQKPLIDNDLWAVSPLAQLLSEVSIFYAEKEQYARAVAISALIAVECNPYRYTCPFHDMRLKNLVMIVKLLAHTAESSAALRRSSSNMASKAGFDSEMHKTLADMDQVSLSQMLLLIVLKMGPPGCHSEWELGIAARDLLRDIDDLGGRKQELSLINAWNKDLDSEASRAFFQYAVVEQMKTLANLGRGVLRVDFGV